MRTALSRIRPAHLTAVTLLGLSLALWPAAARAQDPEEPAANAPAAGAKKKPPPVNMVVTVGQGDLARSGRRLPVKVVLDNNEGSVTGHLELRSLTDRQVTRMPVDLPRGAHKEYTLFATLHAEQYAVANAPAELILHAGGRELAKQTLAPKFPDDAAIVLSCTGDGSGLQFLADDQRFRVSHVSPQDMPRQWAGYEPADVVALNGRAWTSLNDEQRRAFRIWVERGGSAILCGESLTEWRDPEGSALAGVRPADLRSEPELRCVAPWGNQPYRARAGGLLTATGPLRPGARALFSEDGRPLIVERETLSGRVVWLGFDAFRQTFREWDGSLAFWRAALRKAREAAGAPRVQNAEGVDDLRQAAGALPRLPAPPVWAIVVFGVVYAVIFGPLNIWMLRRMRRTVRSWLFTPALAAGMTLVALAAGQSWGSASTVLSGVTVLHAVEGGRTALEDELVCLFSPTNRDFDLAVDDPAPDLEDMGGIGENDPPPLAGLGWPDRQEDGVSRWESTAQQLYSARLFRLRRPSDLGGSVEAELSSGSRPVGTVKNGSYLALKQAYLVSRGHYYWIGDLASGATVNVGAAGWKDRLPTGSDNVEIAGELRENRQFRAGVSRAWANARDLLITHGENQDPWLVAQCPEYRPGLEVSTLPYSNRAALFLVQLSGEGDR
ncbi:MAG: hypothetical protein ACK47B_24975 [Armatimonadota bacterium]